MRLKINKTKNKIFYYVFDSYRENGKIVTKTIEKIGEHYSMIANGISDPEDFANKRVEELNQERKNNKLSITETYNFTEVLPNVNTYSKSTYKNIGWLYIDEIYKNLEISNFLSSINNKAKYDLNAIIEYFVVNRCLFPGSKREAFLNKDSFLFSPDYNLYDGYRALTPLDKYNNQLQQKLFEGTKKCIDLNTDVLYYDCTNFYFECEEEDENLYNEDGDIIQWGLRKYGYGKEHRPNPIVQLGLFTDANSIPISYCVHHGSNNEQNTTIPLENRMIRDYKTSKFIYCSDGGLGSFDNRFFNTLQGRDYVVSQSLKKTAESELESIFKDLNWKYVNNDKKVSLEQFKSILDKKFNGPPLTNEEELYIENDMIYKAFPMERIVSPSILKQFKLKGKVSLDETVFVTFSAKYYLYQKEIFERQLDTATKWLNKDPDTLRKEPNDVRRLITTSSTTDNGEIANNKSNSINTQQVDYEKKFHGFYAVATSLDKGIKEILAINSSRWKIEQSFRLLKTDFDTRPMYTSTPEHIRGHIAICYISLLIYRILERKIYLLNNNHYSSNQILNTLRNMNVVPISDCNIYQSLYTGSSVLDNLESLFDLGLNKKYYRYKNLKLKSIK